MSVVITEQMLAPDREELINELLMVVGGQSWELHLLLISRPLSLTTTPEALEENLGSLLERLTPLQKALHLRGMAATLEVRYDYPFAEAVVRAALEAEADLIIKPSEHDGAFNIGLIGNEDWDLLRMSPIPIWFAKSGSDPSHSVAAAVQLDEPELLERPNPNYLDDVVVNHARFWARHFGTRLDVVHACETPELISQARGEMDVVAGTEADLVTSQLDLQQNIELEHAERLHRFVRSRGLNGSQAALVVGATWHALTDYVTDNEIGLMLVGVREGQSTWNRVLGRSVGEHTLSAIQCDVLFVKPVDMFLPTINEPSYLISIKRDPLPVAGY